jgi:hypothetical protein
MAKMSLSDLVIYFLVFELNYFILLGEWEPGIVKESYVLILSPPGLGLPLPVDVSRMRLQAARSAGCRLSVAPPRYASAVCSGDLLWGGGR